MGKTFTCLVLVLQFTDGILLIFPIVHLSLPLDIIL